MSICVNTHCSRRTPTALHLAAASGIGESVDKLLDRGSSHRLSAYEKWGGGTPLHFAAKYGSSDTVRSLLNSTGININWKNFAASSIEPGTALSLAMERQDEEGGSIAAYLKRHEAIAGTPNERVGCTIS